jgi:hypothetical protein
MTPEDLCKVAQPGDVFATKGKGLLPALVRFGQWLDDCESSPYSHIGGFAMELGLNPFVVDGVTIESRTRIGRYHIRDHAGRWIIVMRHRQMDYDKFLLGWRAIGNNIGQVYPVMRLLLHAIDMVRGHLWKKLTGGGPPDYCSSFSLHGDWPVCSELWAQFFLAAGLETGFPEGKEGSWRGVAPDDFYDAWRNRPDLWTVIALGELRRKDDLRGAEDEVHVPCAVREPDRAVCGIEGESAGLRPDDRRDGAGQPGKVESDSQTGRADFLGKCGDCS